MTGRTLERQLLLAGALVVGLTALALAIALNLGGRVPVLKPLGRAGAATNEWISSGDARQWLATAALTRPVTQTNLPNPFFTLHFQPPPPPTTRQAELTYHGLYTTSDSNRMAFILVDQKPGVFTNGARVIADHAIREIAFRTLVLTNPAGRTNVLEFNVKKALEVPIP